MLDDPYCLPGRVIVIDDCSPERKLSRWLEHIAAKGRILLIRNVKNQGFVASINHGIAAAERHDVVLLNSDTEVPPGWLRRLAAHAYAAADVGSVSPFSNNATICSYPGSEGGPMPSGKSLAELDAACREANAGRSVAIPTAVGFCMFIRRAALDQVGTFDAETFGRGYGEENDFCLRASARGWRHLLACDTFVYHQGKVSFGAQSASEARGVALLTKRYPDYQRIIRRHVRLDPAGGARFALTAALFRRSGRPCILMVSHDLGGGVQHHIEEVIRTVGERANFLLLQSTANGVALSVPTMPGHPTLPLAGQRVDDLVRFLRAAGVTRLHIHHLMGMELDVRRLIHELGVSFDFTVHDYFTICPQVNLLPQFDQHYCGEPGPAGCNACIAERRAPKPVDILAWRLEHAWALTEADRVFCPSEDVRRRLAQYRLDRWAVVVPHEPVTARSWRLRPKLLGRSKRLRVGLIGVLADQKGARTAAAVAEAADPRAFEFRLIGYVERPLPSPAAERIQKTGEYDDADLPQLIAEAKLHIAWFPAQWPETYSYTLSAAIDAGLPIIASDIGAFSERLAGRPLTWLVDPAAAASVWLDTFARARAALAEARSAARGKPRVPAPDFYATDYLNTARQTPRPRWRDGCRASRITVVVVPERLETGRISPCAYIRLLLPLAHPAIGADIDVILAEPEEALRYRPDIIATHRYAVPDIETADQLRAHCNANRITLLYDLDDDLTHIPRSHPEANELGPRASLVVRLLRHADAVSVSTPTLRARLARLPRCVGGAERSRRATLVASQPGAALASGRNEYRVYGHRDARAGSRHRSASNRATPRRVRYARALRYRWRDWRW